MPSPTTTVRNQKGARTKTGCAITFIVWLIAIATFFWASAGSPTAEEQQETLSSIALLVAVFVAPIAGILLIFDLIQYLNWKQKGGAGALFWRALVGLGCWLTAFVILAIVLAATAAGIDSDWRGLGVAKIAVSLLWVVLVLFFLRIAWELLKLPFNRKSSSTEIAENKAFERRQYDLAHPDFTGLEVDLAFQLPDAYKAMFAPGSEWLTDEWMLYPKGLENDDDLHDVIGLEPARTDALRHHSSHTGPFVCFAFSEFGEYWLLCRGTDPAVFHVDLSGQFPDESFREISSCLSKFLAWPKEKFQG